MLRKIKSSDARKNWSEVINTAVRNSPVIIRRNKDVLSLMSVEHLKLLLEKYTLTLKIMKEDDNSFTGVVEELDIMENASDVDLLREKIFKELLEYSREYMDEFQMHYHSTNRASHFPYVQKILVNENRVSDVIVEYHTGTKDA